MKADTHTKVRKLQAEEQTLVRRISTRLALTKAAGRVPRLERLANALALVDFEVGCPIPT